MYYTVSCVGKLAVDHFFKERHSCSINAAKSPEQALLAVFPGLTFNVVEIEPGRLWRVGKDILVVCVDAILDW